ncbi:RelA/SpoT domain-containing protein [Paenibacillus sp. FSL H7-0350]|uniref:GTP pyrophosphokinase n=1 Tax=Paenibacillus sp. FSL H7-0350 TaxID=2975345 RepID=UPI0031582EA8
MSAQVKNIDEIMQWYTINRPKYSSLASKVENIIEEVLDSAGITYYSISSRAKETDSFFKKASKDKYNDPINQIQDLAGIRIITYIKSEVIKCCEVIKPLFKIDESNSVDKGMELGSDKVGYRSVHYVATLTDSRLELPEYKIFKDLTFEIQIRTILEHAWADIAHDRSYKFKGEFPLEYDIQRRFALASATLELVDREFDSIAQTLDIYESETVEKTKRGELDISINITSLSNYLPQKLELLIKNEDFAPVFNKGAEEIIDELLAFGIKSIYELDQIITDNPSKFTSGHNNYVGFLRNVMMYTDLDKYFREAWNDHWSGIDIGTINLLKKAGVDIMPYVIKHDMAVDTRDE